MKIIGYANEISCKPGDEVDFFISCEPANYKADVVKLIHGDTNPDGPGFKVQNVKTTLDGSFPGRVQRIYSGSHALVDDHALLNLDNAFSVQVMVCPTLPDGGLQGLISRWDEQSQKGFVLAINEQGEVCARLGAGTGKVVEISSGKPVLAGLWYLAALTRDEDGNITLLQHPWMTQTNSRFAIASSLESTTASVTKKNVDACKFEMSAPLVMAGIFQKLTNEPIGLVVQHHFSGKLDRPRIYSRALSHEELVSAIEAPQDDHLVGAWNFQREITKQGIRQTRRITDVSDNKLHGRTINLPTRGVTGYNWLSQEMNFIHAPDEYGAIHFHDDDLDDARWDRDFSLRIPDELPSGLYAVRLVAEDDIDYVPFFVRAKAGKEKRICLLAPTASYMAYANDHVSLSAPLAQLLTARVPILQESTIVLSAHREFGLSTYDTHNDGSGVAHSTRLRPILNMRPGFRHWLSPSLWQFNADLHLIDWLTEKGYEFDVVTDEDLHLEGESALAPYKAVLTGSHPEYYSGAMLDALHNYTDTGGRLMYMGANGFYWVTQFDPESPTNIEVRKGHGSNAWKCAPGEYHISFSGEYGTLWRHRGRAPQRLVGTGFGSEGLDVSSYYKRTPESYGQDMAWMFKGIDENLLGDFGLVGGGAAGLELDIYDPMLGSPPESTIVAASQGHTDGYLEVTEELFFNVPGSGGTQNAKVRADIVYFPTNNGGAVWSCSSISYCGSLSHDNYENNISTLTANVLDQFASDGPAPI